MKTTLSLNALNGGAFHCLSAREVELEDSRILCNDVRLPHDTTNYHGVKLWVIGNEYGVLCAVWASHEQDALDEACDAGLLGGLAIEESDVDSDEEDGREGVALLGNAGEPHDLTYCWMQTVRLNGPEDWKLIARLAEARGANQNTLDR